MSGTAFSPLIPADQQQAEDLEASSPYGTANNVSSNSSGPTNVWKFYSPSYLRSFLSWVIQSNSAEGNAASLNQVLSLGTFTSLMRKVPLSMAILMTCLLFNLLYLLILGASFWTSFTLMPLYVFPTSLHLHRLLFFPILLIAPSNNLIYSLVFSGISIFIYFYGFLLACMYWERIWGSRVLAFYLLVVVNLSTWVSATLHVLLTYVLVSSDFRLISNGSYYGPIAWCSSLLVAFKQWCPELLLDFGFGKARVKWLPLYFVTVHLVSSFILPFPQCSWKNESSDGASGSGGVQNRYIPFIAINVMGPWVMAFAGFYFGWAYLRFYDNKSHNRLVASKNSSGIDVPSTLQRGDRSDAFAFDTFFPAYLEPVIKGIARWLTRFGTAIKVIPKEAQELKQARRQKRTSPNDPTSVLVSGETNEQDRRKALALKALDQHLKKERRDSSSSNSTK